MKITEEQLEYLQQISQIRLMDAEKEAVREDLEELLTYLEKLQEVDTEDVEPITHMADHACSLRADIPKTKLTKEEALKNAPKTDGKFFLAPKTIKKP